MLRGILLLTATFWLISCGSFTHFSQSKLVQSQFNLSPYTLTISHPEYQPSDYPRSTSVFSFDLNDQQKEDFNRLFWTVYEYRGSMFHGVYGDLKLSVRVNKWDGQEFASKPLLFPHFTEHLDKIDAIEVETAVLNAHSWYKYQFNESNSHFLATPLNEHFYVQVVFHYVDNDRGHNSGWLDDAQKTSNRIMASIELRQD